MSSEGPDRKKPYHPRAESPEALVSAHEVALRILAETADDVVAEDLLDVCRMMSLEQLAYALLQMQHASSYPARDRATAEAFLEKHKAKLN